MFYSIKAWWAESKEKQLQRWARKTITKRADSNETLAIFRIQLTAFIIQLFLCITVLFFVLGVFHGDPVMNIICSSYFVDAALFNVLFNATLRYTTIALIYRKENPIKQERLAMHKREYYASLFIAFFNWPFVLAFVGCYLWYLCKIVINGPFLWSISFKLLFESSYLNAI